jgi:hypothetical protein
VDDAQLHVGQRPGGSDRFGQALELIAADDEAVADAPVGQLGQQGDPELGALAAGGAAPNTSRSPSMLTPIAT